MGNMIKVPFVEFESKVPLVEFRAGEHAFVALLDTGSESTLFDPEILKKGNIKPIHTGKAMDFVGFNGKTERTEILAVHDDFILDNQKVNIFGLVQDLSSIRRHLNEQYGKEIQVHAIFGSDFLEHYNTILDFEEHVMRLYM